MKREKRMAVDPTTGEKYEIELPNSEAVKQEILNWIIQLTESLKKKRQKN